MDFNSIVTKDVKVELARFPEPVVIRPPTIADEMYFKNEIGAEKLQEVFTKLEDIPTLLRIVYRLFDIKTKKLVANAEVFDIDDEGNEVKLEAKPYEKLAYLISGQQEVAKILTAFIEARGLSLPEKKTNKRTTTRKKAKATTETLST